MTATGLLVTLYFAVLLILPLPPEPGTSALLQPIDSDPEDAAEDFEPVDDGSEPEEDPEISDEDEGKLHLAYACFIFFSQCPLYSYSLASQLLIR